MKTFKDFEDTVLDSGELMKKTAAAVIGNLGKIIAIFVAAVTVAVTFTDISFRGILSEGFASSLVMILTSGYIIYFSLEDSGERCGMQTEEYSKAKERYDALRGRVTGEDIEPLRDFLREYSERELLARRRSMLMASGLSEGDLEGYLSGKSFDKKARKNLKKTASLKPHSLSVKALLCRERGASHSELIDPEKRKLPSLITKLIPTTLSAFITVAVVLSAKEGLTGADVLSAILRLSALPVMAFRGYSEGYTYAKHSLSLWLEVKAGILEEFFAKGAANPHRVADKK